MGRRSQVATSARGPSHNCPVLVTLRPWTSDDAADLMAARQADPDLDRQFGDRPQSLDEYERFIENELTVEPGQEISLAIDVDGRAIGCVGVACERGAEPVDGDRRAWVHYWTAPAHRGSGLASRACASLVMYAFSQMGVTRVELGHRADNVASRRVALKSGFTPSGAPAPAPRNSRDAFAVESHQRRASDPAPDLQPIPILL